MAADRFEFPGYAFLRAESDIRYDIEYGSIQDGDHTFVLKMMRNKAFAFLSYLVAEVNDLQRKRLWSFKNEGFTGVGVLAKAGDVIVIALVGNGKAGKVERVIPLSKFYADRPLDLQQLLSLKMAAAQYLGREYNPSDAERRWVKTATEQERQEEALRRQAEAEQREAERRERVGQIMARGRLNVYTRDGRQRFGFPVLESEWPSLSHGSYAVRVDSISGDGVIGNVIEAFQVLKEKGKNPKKGFAAPVTSTPPTHPVHAAQNQVSADKPIDTAVAVKDGKPYEVSLFASMDAIRQARKAGLNGGTWVAVKPTDPAAKLEVYAVHTDRMDTIGRLDRL